MSTRLGARSLALLLVLLLPLAGRADAGPSPSPAPIRPRLRIDSELEYYLPTKADRTIQTIFANSLFGVELLRGHLILSAGVTSTVAWGYIHEDRAQSATVFGIGPIFLIRVQPFRIGRFSMLLDVLGGIVVYSGHFPPGGDIYNFTWRLGGAFAVRITAKLTVTAGARWMHVSNGQGLTPKNPSYEGVGISLGLLYWF